MLLAYYGEYLLEAELPPANKFLEDCLRLLLVYFSFMIIYFYMYILLLLINEP